MRIGIRLNHIDTFDARRPGNVQGDELIARGWAKALEQRDDVESVRLHGAAQVPDAPLDVMINFSPLPPTTARARNVLYLQNAFPPDEWKGGTVGVFQAVKSLYDGFVFTSVPLMRACAPGAVIPFATDPDFFNFQPDLRLKYKVSFCGNNIRGRQVNQRYLHPAVPYGLALFGNMWQDELPQVYRGKLPMDLLPVLYSSSAINLNAHIPEHILFQTINLRIYDILACGGFILSDEMAAIEAEFGDAVAMTSGYEDMAAQIERFLGDPVGRMERAERGRRQVVEKHTFHSRAPLLMEYLKQVV